MNENMLQGFLDEIEKVALSARLTSKAGYKAKKQAIEILTRMRKNTSWPDGELMSGVKAARRSFQAGKFFHHAGMRPVGLGIG